ncbi:MAG: glutamate synthase subunit beta [Lachnospiraceae bacterium]|nr:glutamate synthase subunit beta [Lachnospiraceae bacterium]
MGKETGFLEIKRKGNPFRPVAERIRDFEELYDGISEEDRRAQASVCMNCGVPFCQSGMLLSGMLTGCPLHNLIPEWNDEIYRGNYRNAVSRLLKTNPFPEFTGRVCPALCEKACMCGQYGDAVTIHDNEKFLIETAFANGDMQPRIPVKRSKKKVAVIGSGPSGLACADALNQRGHNVTVYEREDAIGGLLMYGIPNMKLDKNVIARRRKLMEEEGITFLTGVDVGRDMPSEELVKEYDAVVLCCGAKQARQIPAADPAGMKGVYMAVDFLSSTTKALMSAQTTDLAQAKKGSFISAKDKHVVIIGGGDTGNDCIGTAIRHGAKTVTAVEMMPKPPEERAADNPWPEWPKVFKVDYGHEEAIKTFGKDVRLFCTTVTDAAADKNGKIKSVTLADISFEDRRPVIHEETKRTIPCELLLIAAGFTGCEPYVPDAFGIKRTERGNVMTAEGKHRAGDGKIFTAGDMHIGQSLVVRAIAEGLAAADEVDVFLMGYGR